mmetsp:Transcript_26695/g.61435  ORF Transcript_26695/g.61435 Transcript_26695/m.61435 type:complete len:262 (-) Transcript_26695:150-935(-)
MATLLGNFHSRKDWTIASNDCGSRVLKILYRALSMRCLSWPSGRRSPIVLASASERPEGDDAITANSFAAVLGFSSTGDRNSAFFSLLADPVAGPPVLLCGDAKNFEPGALRPFREDTGSFATFPSSAASGNTFACGVDGAGFSSSVATIGSSMISSATGLTGSCAVIACVDRSPEASAAALNAFSLRSATCALICSWSSCTASSVSSLWKHLSAPSGFPSRLAFSSLYPCCDASRLLIEAELKALDLASVCQGADDSGFT